MSATLSIFFHSKFLKRSRNCSQFVPPKILGFPFTRISRLQSTFYPEYHIFVITQFFLIFHIPPLHFQLSPPRQIHPTTPIGAFKPFVPTFLISHPYHAAISKVPHLSHQSLPPHLIIGVQVPCQKQVPFHRSPDRLSLLTKLSRKLSLSLLLFSSARSPYFHSSLSPPAMPSHRTCPYGHLTVVAATPLVLDPFGLFSPGDRHHDNIYHLLFGVPPHEPSCLFLSSHVRLGKYRCH